MVIKAPKSLAALLLAIMLLFSQLGMVNPAYASEEGGVGGVGQQAAAPLAETEDTAEAEHATAAEMLQLARNYYDVVKGKNLASWWDYGAVYGGWGSVEGYQVSNYWGKLTANQPTDYAGLIFGLIITGNDPYHTPSGQNIIAELIGMQDETGKFDARSNQQMWSIIALNAANAETVYNGTNPEKSYDKEGAVRTLLGMQQADGGFGYGKVSDLDYTGMALIALTGSTEIDGVSVSIDRAVAYIKSKQLTSGTFSAGWGNDNGNTHVTVISGLAAAGEDLTSADWTVEGKTPIDTLAQYQGASGGFMYQTKTGKVDNMASYQGIIALGDIIHGDSVWKRIKLPDTHVIGEQPSATDIDAAIDTAAAYFRSGVTRTGTDWSAIGLTRAGQKLPETYVQHLKNRVSIAQGNFDLVTDLERTIMALSAAGIDATNVEGYNLIEKLYNADAAMTAQGVNGLLFALIALDGRNYVVPDDSVWTRNLIVNEILSRQNADGGFSLSGGASDPDLTAMAVTALAPYVNHQAVTAAGAIAKAANWLSDHQQANGGYLSWGVDSSESVSQAIIALTAIGIDPTNPAYTKDGVHLIDKLFRFRLSDGSFSHAEPLQSNGMATEQALQALTAYRLFKEGSGERLYDFTKPLPGTEPVEASSVSIRIEGPESRIGEGSVTAATPLEALEALADAEDIELEKAVSWGALRLSIGGFAPGHYGETDYGFWDYAIHRGDKWITSYGGALDAIILEPSDEVLFYYNNYSTMPIDSIAIVPAAGSTIYEDVSFEVRVQKTEMDYATFGFVPVPAGGVDVKLYNQAGETVAARQTNAQGVASFGHLQADDYTVAVSGYATNGAPAVVHTTVPLQVQSGYAATPLPLPDGEEPRIVIPLDQKDYLIPVTTEDADKSIQIVIPDNSGAKTFVQLPTGSGLPTIEATKGGISLLIPQGREFIGGGSPAIELLTSVDKTSQGIEDAAKAFLPNGFKLDGIDYAVGNGGGARVVFDGFVSLTFAGMAGKNVIFVENGVPQAIEKFASDSAGADSGRQEYAYDNGVDLVVKTNHFTEYVVYTSSKNETPGGGDNPNPDPIGQVTLSVDKLTIGKGYVVPAGAVELRAGDTVWDVLQRTLDSRGIAYGVKWYEGMGVYVQSIDGDGEFDHGEGSGWMYFVNGEPPGYGASVYTLKAGDKVQWRYTTNMGEDLESGLPSEGGPEPGESGGPSDPFDPKPVIDVPATGAGDYSLTIEKGWQSKELITLNIPNTGKKVILQLGEVKSGIPMLTAIKGDLSVAIDKGTVLKSGDSNIEVLTAIGNDDSALLTTLRKGLIIGRAESLAVSHAFAMGNPDGTVLFDRALTLTVKGGKGQSAGFVENDVFTPILIYASDEKGKEATKAQEKFAYAYVQGNDLIIKTNHFTSFVTYTVDKLDLQAWYKDANLISDWAAEAVAEATGLKFLEGSGGLFQPKGTVTRAQFAKLLAGIVGLNTGSAGTIDFKDVAKGDWFFPYVNAAVEAGYMAGFGNGQFRPNEPMTREQMAVVLVKAAGLKAEGALPLIADADFVSPWAIPAVEIIVNRELMQGWNGKFQPRNAVTREMAAVVAMRAYDLLERGTGTETAEPVQELAAAREQLAKTAAFLQEKVTNPVIASVGGDWTVFGLARSGAPVPKAYYDQYYANVEQELKEKEGKLHSVKYTEYDRVILGLASIGRDATQAAGYNLLAPLADYETVIKQGINGPIFALIALDSKGYSIPSDSEVKTATTRQLLVDFILGREIAGGGWALGASATTPDSDLTAMAIQGLTPYYDSDAKVKAAVDRALQWLSKAQLADGGFASGTIANLESTAQVVIALAGLGIDPHTDAGFVKHGRSSLDGLLGYADASGGFFHVKKGSEGNGGAAPGEVDLMATDQALLALAAYVRLVDGKTGLYELTDVE